MFSLRRAVPRNARLNFSRSTRRHASHGAGHAEHAHHAEPVKEGFGPSFYIALGTPLLFYVVYQLSQTDSQKVPFVTSLIDQYTSLREAENRRNVLHMAASDQAAYDRQLFASEIKGGLSRGVDLRFPEQFNTGSAINVQAGQGRADMSKLIAYYQEKHDKTEAERLAKIKDGKIRTVYDS